MINENLLTYQNLLQKMLIIEQAKQFKPEEIKIKKRIEQLSELITVYLKSRKNFKKVTEFINEKKYLLQKLELITIAESLNEQETDLLISRLEQEDDYCKNNRLTILDRLFNPFYYCHNQQEKQELLELFEQQYRQYLIWIKKLREQDQQPEENLCQKNHLWSEELRKLQPDLKITNTEAEKIINQLAQELNLERY